MNQIVSILSGKKTYIVGALCLFYAVMMYLGVFDPQDLDSINKVATEHASRIESIRVALEGLGLIFLRSGVSKVVK